jgi:hypothetical protein
MVFRAAKEKDDDPARKRACAPSHPTPLHARVIFSKRASAYRYKVVVDLHAKFAGLCKSVEEEGQVTDTGHQHPQLPVISN